MRTYTATSALALLMIGFLMSGITVAGQFEQIVSQDYPRPMDKVIRTIEVRCDCVITYEDPQYTSSQVIDVTSKTRRDGKAEPKVWSPRPSFFNFLYDVSAAEDRNLLAKNLNLVVEQFNGSRKDGVAFKLTQSRRSFHVIPAQGSILNTPIAVNVKQGTAHDVIRSMLSEISRVHGKKIDLAGIGLRVPVSLTVTRGGANELLDVILESIDPKLSWKLLYDFSWHFYVLNIVDSSRPPHQIVDQ
jgi:hypothetical protein